MDQRRPASVDGVAADKALRLRRRVKVGRGSSSGGYKESRRSNRRDTNLAPIHFRSASCPSRPEAVTAPRYATTPKRSRAVKSSTREEDRIVKQMPHMLEQIPELLLLEAVKESTKSLVHP
ncbi:hypothetical protein LEL_07574 [Akanthomyces lecanii RCEF 1005]|uniref:Uncharacterized protein n=1 Tax=Akanthomyces lecanii RCEF 1005 TaxID=1081108 RepID=A0A168FT47_CORDF|nr:hypothetical protein LEL_07574 [Akanthomyces lecanii RCEF 1005]